MEDSDLYGKDEDYSCAKLDEDNEDAKVKEGLMYALGGVTFFALLNHVVTKLLSCFGRVNQGNDNDIDMIVDNADQFADLAHDANSLAQTSASNASMNASTSNSSSELLEEPQTIQPPPRNWCPVSASFLAESNAWMCDLMWVY
jgi:hypothetical protein